MKYIRKYAYTVMAFAMATEAADEQLGKQPTSRPGSLLAALTYPSFNQIVIV
jgi:hypothetical protein